MKLKNIVRRALAQRGYIVRSAGTGGVTGVDLLHDVRVLLGGTETPTLFDVGANIGQTIQAFRDVFPSSKIISFEPSPATFATLSRQYGKVEGCRLENLALGDSESTLPFFVSDKYSVNDSLLTPVWNEKGVQVDVAVRTLDGYCNEHAIDTIDFLKIDTQGYDLSCLRGADRLLHERRVRAFCVEVNPRPMYCGQPPFVEVLVHIDRLGYELIGFYDQMYRNNKLEYANVCYVAPAN